MKFDNQVIADISKAISDANRIKILRMLRWGEMCACKILEELNISQPTLSHHMRILCECSLVNYRKEGKWMHYSINSQTTDILKNFMSYLSEFQLDEEQ